jgi:hypothetical protein
MKKFLALVWLGALPALAGCGEGGEQNKTKAEPVNALAAGQYRASYEVTNFRAADAGTPKINMPVGTRVEAGGCLAAGDAARPSPALFVGEGFERCEWNQDFYMRNGRLTSGITCQRPGVGPVHMTLNGDFTARSFEGTLQMSTRLPTDGDVVIAARIEGEQTSPQCTAGSDAEAGGGGDNQSQTK